MQEKDGIKCSKQCISIKKFAAIGATVTATSFLIKTIVGGEEHSVFSNSSCE